MISRAQWVQQRPCTRAPAGRCATPLMARAGGSLRPSRRVAASPPPGGRSLPVCGTAVVLPALRLCAVASSSGDSASRMVLAASSQVQGPGSDARSARPAPSSPTSPAASGRLQLNARPIRRPSPKELVQERDAGMGGRGGEGVVGDGSRTGRKRQFSGDSNDSGSGAAGSERMARADSSESGGRGTAPSGRGGRGQARGGRGGGQAGGHDRDRGDASSDAKALTSSISAASCIVELEQLEQRHGASFNHIHVSAAFNRAAKVVTASRQPVAFAHPLLGRLWRRLEPQLGSCETWSLGNVVWACGKLGYAEPALLDTCYERLAAAGTESQPQCLSSALYGAALLWDRGYRISEQLLHRLVEALVQSQDAANPQALSNTLWAAATAKFQLSPQHVQSLVAVLVRKRAEAQPQNMANALWAAATMVIQLEQQQAQQLVAALVEKRETAKPQELSSALWAAATMGWALPAGDWQLLLEALVAKVPEATGQAVSNTLWAAAKRKADFAPAVRRAQLSGAEAALLRLAEGLGAEQVTGMTPQAVSNSLWALAELGLRPPRLTAQLAGAALQLAPAMKPQEVNNTALALAKLGCRDSRLFAALVGAAGSEAGLTQQEITNVGWAVAVADQRQLSAAVVKLCGRLAGQAWGSLVADGHRQLHQVHLWLLDQRPGGGGLAGVLLTAQLRQSAEAWEDLMQEVPKQRRTEIERRVFACAQRLPGLAACSLEARTQDGAFSVDVAATHLASGRRLAIEADGPTHFLWTGREVKGDTLARNRVLAARGYTVVRVPHWEWDEVKGDKTREEAYLWRRVEAAVRASDGGAGPARPGAASAA